jgi:peptidoglycan/LPS O-acetylase OafA/YrhL
LGGYLKRRLARVLPAYLPVLLAWLALTYPTLGFSPVQALRGVAGNLFMVGYWLDAPKVYNWYANAQFLYFLAAPVFFALLTRAKKPLRALTGLLVVSVGVGAAVIGQPQMMGLSRLPILLLGMAFGMDWKVSEKRGLVRAGYIAAAAAGLAVLVWCFGHSAVLLNDFGMYWYPFALIAPGLCVGLAYLFGKAGKARAWFAPLRLAGESSFEIYLVNIWLYELGKQWQLTDAWAWLCVMAASLALGVLYHLLVKACVRAWQARRGAPAAHADA